MPSQAKVISFPNMGYYAEFVSPAFARLFPKAKILPPKKTTNRTLEIGSRLSPENVCAPFKYTLGNLVEALEAGANVLIQTGFGCVFGYYGEVQEKILRDLGYDFTFVCFSKRGLKDALKAYKKIGGTKNIFAAARTLLLALYKIRVMDGFEFYMRKAIGFEKERGSFLSLRESLASKLKKSNSFLGLSALNRRAKKEAKSLADIPEGALKVGLVGELFTLMEPFANFYIESFFAKNSISVSRIMSVTFLAKPHKRRAMKKARGHLKYHIGATGVDTAVQTIAYALEKYDGVVHIKSFGCTPEVNVLPTLTNICDELSIPILDLSFDTHTAEAGINTRLEAFIDMLKMRKQTFPAEELAGCPKGGAFDIKEETV